MGRGIGWGAGVAGLALAAALVGGCATSDQGPPASKRTASAHRTSPSPASSQASPSPAASPTRAGPRAAATVLATLPIKGRAPMTGYSREQFGPAWTDDTRSPMGHNGCDTRNDILRRDLVRRTVAPDTDGCVVLAGTLLDPYTGRAIAFERGLTTSLEVQIDHVVALGNAWQTGAQRWTAQTRADLANDPLELLAVDGPANESKGDGDAATWLPPNRAFRCDYVARQIAVKARYGLWVTSAERDAMVRILSTCPGQQVPVGAGRVHVDLAAQGTGPSKAGSGGGGAFYENCTAARAAGAAPLHRGQPGYRPEMDGDGDGVACED